MTTSKLFFETKEQYLAFRQAWRDAINNKTHHMTAEHFMFYNIIRGKDPQHGFTPFQRLSKIEGMGYFNRGAYMTAGNLSRMNNAWRVKDKETFLAPFGDTFTAKDFDRFVGEGFLPEVTAVTSNFGKGLKLFHRVKNGEIKPTTSEALMAFYNESTKEVA